LKYLLCFIKIKKYFTETVWYSKKFVPFYDSIWSIDLKLKRPHHFYRILNKMLFQGDPLLMDLHTEVTLDEVNSHIALEHGQAITVNVRRADDTVLREYQYHTTRHLLYLSFRLFLMLF